MAIEVGTNSYTDVSTADTILEDFFDTENWDSETTANKELALKQATRNIDGLYFQGIKYTDQQILKFPRNYVTYAVPDTSGEIPDNVKKATALEALKVLDDRQNETIEDVAAMGITGRSIEGASVSYSGDIIKASRKQNQRVGSKKATEFLKPWIKRTFNR